MEHSAYIGISISEFWEMTPKEIFIYVKSYNKRKKDEAEDFTEKFKLIRNEALSIAYVNAQWTIQWLGKKHPPKLEKILDGLGKEKKAMTDKEMLNQVKMLNRMFGGEEVG